MIDKNINQAPLSVKIKDFESQGYTSQLKVEDGKLIDLTKRKSFKPNEVKVIQQFRFEGESNPDDMAILYVIECNDGSKGLLTNAYGMYGDEEIDQFVSEIPGEETKL